ncbi:hypothetical protein LSAT2_010396 [Lamellibrachia satsuma]|nr:hypothetical protein LSAT2_010396 [Lamellibrachia satsuma]
MASSNTTLTSLWIDDAEASGIKCVPNTPGKRGSSNGAEIKEDVRQFYKSTGLEPDAEQANVDNAVFSLNATLWMLVYFWYVISFLGTLNRVNNALDPEVIGKKR